MTLQVIVDVMIADFKSDCGFYEGLVTLQVIVDVMIADFKSDCGFYEGLVTLQVIVDFMIGDFTSDCGFYECLVMLPSGHFYSENNYFNFLPIHHLLGTARGCRGPILPWVQWVHHDNIC